MLFRTLLGRAGTVEEAAEAAEAAAGFRPEEEEEEEEEEEARWSGDFDRSAAQNCAKADN